MMENFQQLEILETGFQTAHSLYSLYLLITNEWSILLKLLFVIKLKINKI